MAEDPGAIREAIATTRAEMAETIEALGRKADVKARVNEKVTVTADHAKEALSDAAAKSTESPWPVVGAAAAVALLVALLLWRRRRGD